MSIELEIERRIAREVAAWQQRVVGKGRPLEVDEGWLHTPKGLRMPFRVLKNANIPPYEVELFHQRARLRERLESATEPGERARLRQHLSDLDQSLACRLEGLLRLGSG